MKPNKRDVGMFKEAEVILADHAQAVEVLERELLVKEDWDNPEAVREYRCSMRLDKRLEALDRLVPGRRCPCCSESFYETRQWVISRAGARAVCRSCFLSARGEKFTSVTIEFSESLFVIPARRFGIKGFEIRQARDVLGVTRKRFAQVCGWTSIYQLKLERGDYLTVRLETAETIVEAFARLGLVTKDDLFDEPDKEGERDSDLDRDLADGMDSEEVDI